MRTTQTRLPFRKPDKQAQATKFLAFDSGNLKAARLILAANPKHGGLVREWAEQVVKRLGTPEEQGAL